MANTFILRAHRRSKTRCVMHYLGPHVSGTGIVQDVSLAGWRVLGDQRITQGDILSLRIFLPLFRSPSSRIRIRPIGSRAVSLV